MTKKINKMYLSRAKDRAERLRLEIITRAARGTASGICLFVAMWLVGQGVQKQELGMMLACFGTAVAFLVIPVYLSIENLREIEEKLANDWREACDCTGGRGWE